jgi:hypothetical protein
MALLEFGVESAEFFCRLLLPAVEKHLGLAGVMEKDFVCSIHTF